MKGGLTTTIDDLKQLLLGTLLWSPLTFMQVSGWAGSANKPPSVIP